MIYIKKYYMSGQMIKFWRGIRSKFDIISTKDPNSLYFVTDSKVLYLGNQIISNYITDAITSLGGNMRGDLSFLDANINFNSDVASYLNFKINNVEKGKIYFNGLGQEFAINNITANTNLVLKNDKSLVYKIGSTEHKIIDSNGVFAPSFLSPFTGATSSTGGTKGLVPAPLSSNVDHFLKGNGTWAPIPSSTDTWRPVIDNLITASTDKSLSSNQGKILNEKKLDKSAISEWALSNSKPKYTYSEISAKPFDESFTTYKYNFTGEGYVEGNLAMIMAQNIPKLAEKNYNILKNTLTLKIRSHQIKFDEVTKYAGALGLMKKGSDYEFFSAKAAFVCDLSSNATILILDTNIYTDFKNFTGSENFVIEEVVKTKLDNKKIVPLNTGRNLGKIYHHFTAVCTAPAWGNMCMFDINLNNSYFNEFNINSSNVLNFSFKFNTIKSQSITFNTVDSGGTGASCVSILPSGNKPEASYGFDKTNNKISLAVTFEMFPEFKNITLGQTYPIIIEEELVEKLDPKFLPPMAYNNLNLDIPATSNSMSNYSYNNDFMFKSLLIQDNIFVSINKDGLIDLPGETYSNIIGVKTNSYKDNNDFYNCDIIYTGIIDVSINEKDKELFIPGKYCKPDKYGKALFSNEETKYIIINTTDLLNNNIVKILIK